MCTILLITVLAITLASCAGTPDPEDAPVVQHPQKQVFDMFEAALRYRLAQAPLRHHLTCYVYLEDTRVSIAEAQMDSFAKRFPEYHMIMRDHSAGNLGVSPWFYMRLGRSTQDHAWIMIDYQGDELMYTLVRQGDRWVVVAAKPIIII